MLSKLALKKLQKTTCGSTTNTYCSVLKSILKHVTMKQLSRPSKSTLETIERQVPNEQSRNVLYAALLKTCKGKLACEKYKTLMTKGMEAVRQSYDEQIPTMEVDREQSEVKLKEAIASFRNYRTYNSAVRALLFSLYLDRPPRRLELADTKHRNFDKHQDNYFDPKKQRIVLNKYKTAKRYGRQIVKLSPLELECAKYLAEIASNDKLFRFGRSGLSHYLTRKLGFSVNVARQSYVSKLHENTPQLANMREAAKQMGHSVNSQISFYMK